MFALSHFVTVYTDSPKSATNLNSGHTSSSQQAPKACVMDIILDSPLPIVGRAAASPLTDAFALVSLEC